MLIYVAGPYTQGDPATNVASALEAADQVLALGHVPLVPHLSHYWHQISPKDYEAWLAIDLAYLAACDGLLRLPGYSPGADREVEFAKAQGLPVWYGLEALAAWVVEWKALEDMPPIMRFARAGLPAADVVANLQRNLGRLS